MNPADIGRMEVDITAPLAVFLDLQIQNLRSIGAAAKAYPFGCADHQNDCRAFEAIEFLWAGDGQHGGVHLRLRWLPEGLQLLDELEDAAVSPTLRFNPSDPVKWFFTVGINVGSLVSFSECGSLPIKRGGSYLRVNPGKCGLLPC